MSKRTYPDETVGSFPAPPEEYEDREGRTIEIRRYDGEDEALVEMYQAFDPEDRAQGIPPTDTAQIRGWIDAVLEDGLDVVAWHDGRAVGHATLVPDEVDDSYELAIFVLQPYQGAGIGTQLVEFLLGAAQAEGIERIWLSVERWNTPAISVYEKVGFEQTNTDSFELKMSMRLE